MKFIVMETKIYNQKGEEAGKIKLPDSVFGLPRNDDLVHQVVVSMQANKRTPVAHAKGRSEVSGGGKKPWRQKGTGRARHGSSRSPIWRGGGVTHGPDKEKNYTKKINRKMMTNAFYTVISQKLRDNNILFLDKFDLQESKTKKADEILNSISKVKNYEELKTKKRNKALVATPQKEEIIEKSFRNIPGMNISETRNLNVSDLLKYKYLILEKPKESIKILEK